MLLGSNPGLIAQLEDALSNIPLPLKQNRLSCIRKKLVACEGQYLVGLRHLNKMSCSLSWPIPSIEGIKNSTN